MTELLCQQDSYLREFTATVVAVHGDGVVLDRTAFYPGGGGQPADTGSLEGGSAPLRVTGVRREGEQLVHVVDGTPALAVGDRVAGRLDWERRYLLMRTHTALHLLCGVVWRDYGRLVTGGNMEPGHGRLDFDFPELNRAIAAEIERRMNEEVRAARPVRVAFHTREAAAAIPDLVRTKANLIPVSVPVIRTVEIVGLDLQADGGTHVASTAEVGPLRVLDIKSKGKANKRIEVGLGAETPAPEFMA